MNTRFYNAKILIGKTNLEIISGELHVASDRIIYIGDTKKNNLTFDREINLNGNLIMPGFKNAHTHSPMTFLRSYADDLPLSAWLHERVFPMEAKLKEEHIYTFTKIALLEYIAGGTTTCFDMYFGVEHIAKACEEFGFRMVFCGAVNDFSQSPEILENYYNQYNKTDSLISFKLGFHGEYTTALPILKEIADLSKKYKAPVFTHNSETKSEVEDCKSRYGMSPTALFDSLGIYDFGGGGFHCIYLDENDLNIFKNKNLWAVTNPGSNLKLASGIAPIQKMINKGINLAIGTDGPASNNSLDMFREIYLTSTLGKYYEENPCAAPAKDILKMATLGGANAMELTDCDCLETGKKADLIVLDLNCPNMQPQNNIINNLVYSGSTSNVILTMINGNILYECGEFFVNEDIPALYERANKYMLDFS